MMHNCQELSLEPRPLKLWPGQVLPQAFTVMDAAAAAAAAFDPLCANRNDTRRLCCWKINCGENSAFLSSIETHSNGNNYAAGSQSDAVAKKNESERERD